MMNSNVSMQEYLRKKLLEWWRDVMKTTDLKATHWEISIVLNYIDNNYKKWDEVYDKL